MSPKALTSFYFYFFICAFMWQVKTTGNRTTLQRNEKVNYIEFQWPLEAFQNLCQFKNPIGTYYLHHPLLKQVHKLLSSLLRCQGEIAITTLPIPSFRSALWLWSPKGLQPPRKSRQTCNRANLREQRPTMCSTGCPHPVHNHHKWAAVPKSAHINMQVWDRKMKKNHIEEQKLCIVICTLYLINAL